MNRTIYIFLGFIGVVVVLNVLFLDYFFIKQRSELLDFKTRLGTLSDSFKLLGNRFNFFPTPPSGTGTSAATISAEEKQFLVGDVCPNSCLSLIYAATLSANPAVSASRLPTAQLVSQGLATQQGVSGGTKGEFFVPMGTASLSQTGVWTDMMGTQTTFDTSNFGSIRAAYFEASLHTAAGQVQVRLYDATTPAVFWSAVLSSSSATGESLSAPITLSRGQKTYRVQMYTTLSTGYLDQARIRIDF